MCKYRAASYVSVMRGPYSVIDKLLGCLGSEVENSHLLIYSIHKRGSLAAVVYAISVPQLSQNLVVQTFMERNWGISSMVDKLPPQ